MNDQPQRNIKLVISYNGAAYHGWQRQAKGIDTVQLRIEQAATRILAHPVTVFGAGRTDAGVHAAGQVANLYTPNFSVPIKNLRRAMNSKLPGDVSVRSTQLVPETFHASRSATGKTYRYRIYLGPDKPVMLDKQVYRYSRQLDTELMQAAGLKLVGTHDFRGFATSAETRENTVRTIFACDVSSAGPEVIVSVRGDGFLYNMVRNVVGTLIEIGRGRWPVDRIDKILASCDRSDAGPTAIADGLSLMCVYYDAESLQIK